jgi:hypothetical protein
LRSSPSSRGFYALLRKLPAFSDKYILKPWCAVIAGPISPTPGRATSPSPQEAKHPSATELELPLAPPTAPDPDGWMEL